MEHIESAFGHDLDGIVKSLLHAAAEKTRYVKVVDPTIAIKADKRDVANLFEELKSEDFALADCA